MRHTEMCYLFYGPASGCPVYLVKTSGTVLLNHALFTKRQQQTHLRVTPRAQQEAAAAPPPPPAPSSLFACFCGAHSTAQRRSKRAGLQPRRLRVKQALIFCVVSFRHQRQTTDPTPPFRLFRNRNHFTQGREVRGALHHETDTGVITV